MSHYFNQRGEPMELLEWVAAMETIAPIEATPMDDGHLVSTIWIGLDATTRAGPPLIFETCVFFNDGLVDQERYATEQEAREGHARIVAKLTGL